ncbi:hypothetical protein DWU99_09080 [Dyella psychrodurans]|uniref:Uncharacterized protein n=1 Tax=Dyella psychrodurans TaxID=1927960 RepID=A0A370XB62_9GAMM|nr:hypothetical protein DWU99_09080 [Dyella psychrodurans]
MTVLVDSALKKMCCKALPLLAKLQGNPDHGLVNKWNLCTAHASIGGRLLGRTSFKCGQVAADDSGRVGKQ